MSIAHLRLSERRMRFKFFRPKSASVQVSALIHLEEISRAG